jgi:hypothetical protein
MNLKIAEMADSSNAAFLGAETRKMGIKTIAGHAIIYKLLLS